MTQCQPPNATSLSPSKNSLQQEMKCAALAKALAHPARVRILKILFQLDKVGGCLNNDLVSQLGLAQSTVSEHLRVLKVAGFIVAEATPPKMCYKINKECIHEFNTLINALLT